MGDIMYDLSLNDNEITFKDLERKIYKYVCDQACSLMKEVLTHLDRRLMEERDTKTYRNKGLKNTCMKTIMGDIEFSRRIYEYTTEEGKRAYKFLLDEYLNMDTIGHISTNLVEKMVDNIANVSYRKASENIEAMCNQKISHTAVWNVIQRVGDKLEKRDSQKIKLNKEGKLQGKKEVKVLFQEEDGIWLSMQGIDKPKGRKNKKKELKLGITYEGWKNRKGSKNQYEVVNKVAFASFGNSKQFKELSDATIAEIYNVDEIETKVINGDGASWIKDSLGEEGVYFQLDPFHKSQAVYRKVKDKKEAKKLIKLLNSEKAQDAIEYIVQLMIKNNSDENELKKLGELFNYFVENREGLVPYHLREEISLPKAPEGLQYRHLGTMEHNICDILAQRMKGRKMAWSIKGANNLAKILAEKASGRIYGVLGEICGGVISENKLEELKEAIVLTAADVNKRPRTSKIYPIKQSKIPFTGSAITNGRKAIRNFFEERTFSELIYR